MASEADKYEILERIGHGSFGVIRKVRRKVDGFVLCRKEICYTKMSEKERHQLQAELNILRQLDHPNIVRYYEKEHHKESHDLHLYMEYCGNGDLGIMIKDLKARGAYADEDLVWTIFAQLVSALYRCHYGEDPPSADTTAIGLARNAQPIRSKQACDRMILHRDLKPENVFLGDGNAVKLGDFGLSKIISSHDFASTYVGTPFYMSPEICAAERYSLYSDIWSLGCVIYELCAKEPPFNAKTHFELIQKIKLGKVAPLPRTYTRELSEVITACLQVNPNARPDTAALLNLPRVKLIRKSQQGTLLIQEHVLAKNQALEELRILKEQVLRLEAEKQTMYDEIYKKLHLEWETRAHLEINRRVDEVEKQYAEMVSTRVEEEVSRRMASWMSSQPTSSTSYTSSTSSSEGRPTTQRSSTPTSIHPDLALQQSILPSLSESILEDESSPVRQHTDLSILSLEDSPLEKKIKPTKRPSRTPFTRARTIAVAEQMMPSPMDVQMISPSPVRSLACLSLSPRRNAHTNSGVSGNAQRQPAISRNIFDRTRPMTSETLFPTSHKNGDEGYFAEEYSLEEANDERSDSDSPTGPKFTLDHTKPAVSAMSRQGSGLVVPRPSLTRQRTTPANLGGNLHLRGKSTSSVNVFDLAAAMAQKRPSRTSLSPVDMENVRPSSPTRKIGATRPMATSPVRKTPSVPNLASPTALMTKRLKDNTPVAIDLINKQSSRTRIQGRTLMELSRDEVCNVPRWGLDGLRRTGSEDLSRDKHATLSPLWDPERDDMPSPFLARGRRGLLRR